MEEEKYSLQTLNGMRNISPINQAPSYPSLKSTQENSFSSHEKEKNNKTNLKYSTPLFLSLVPSLGIILAFGGKLTLLAFSFGTIATYLFDLVGSLEVSKRNCYCVRYNHLILY